MKFKKTILSGLIVISGIALLPSNVFAAGNQALLIGRNYGSGNIDTTIDVTNAKNGLGALTFLHIFSSFLLNLAILQLSKMAMYSISGTKKELIPLISSICLICYFII